MSARAGSGTHDAAASPARGRAGSGRGRPPQNPLPLAGRRWCLLVMEALLAGPLRFNQLRAALGRVAAKTLSACLQELAAEDLLKHVARGEGPDGGPRVFIYELTEKGRDLSDVIASLRAWERKWAKPKE